METRDADIHVVQQS